MKQNRSIALGTFDGLHLGHKEVLSLAKMQEGIPTALLFSEHPQEVVFGKAPPALLTNDKRDALLKEMGIEPLTISFKEIFSLSPEDFFYEILLKRFSAKSLSCGEDYTFGAHKKGNVEVLKALCEKEHIALSVAKTICYEKEPVSSTRIRKAIAEGDMERAKNMLGRPFSFAFPVQHGDARGRTLDCPTINQRFPRFFIQPKKGVYVSRVFIDGKAYAGVTNFGRRPTIENTEDVLAETYILDVSQDLYGRNVELELLLYLRPEQKFKDLAALKNAIQNDSLVAADYFQKILAKNP